MGSEEHRESMPPVSAPEELLSGAQTGIRATIGGMGSGLRCTLSNPGAYTRRILRLLLAFALPLPPSRVAWGISGAR